MGLLDDVIGKVTAALGKNDQQHAGLIPQVVEMLGGAGGIAGLVQAFESKGLGNLVSSWVGTGPNLPVSANQITNVLGNDKIQEMAHKAGISPDVLSNGLSTILPQMVDHLTPNGQIPSAGGLLDQLGGMLKGFSTNK